MNQISWQDFEKIDIRVGTIISASIFEGLNNPAFKLLIDFGPELGEKRSSAQISALYKPEELISKQVIAVLNFPPKQIRNFFSECLVLGIYTESKQVVLLQPDKPVSNGLKIG